MKSKVWRKGIRIRANWCCRSYLPMKILSFLAIVSSLLVVTAPSTVLSIIWLIVVFLLTALVLGILGLTYAALTYVIVYVGAIAILFLFVVQLLDQRNIILESNPKKIFFESGPKNSPDTSSLKRNNVLNIGSSTPLAMILGILLILELSASLPIWNHIGSYNSTSISYKIFDMFSNKADLVSSWSSSFVLVSDHATLIHPLYLATPVDHIYSIYNSTYATWSSLDCENYLSYFGQVQNLGEWLYGVGSFPLMIMSVILLLAMVGPIVLCWRV